MATMKGGEKFAKEIRKIVAAAGRGGVVRVGFLSSARYPDGTPVALVAAVNEFGAPSRGQPPRPAFGNMIAAKAKEWPKAIADLLEANNFDVEKSLTLAGEAIAGQLRQSIAEISSPPLAASTIRRKGFAKPWVDTGHLLGSVDYEVDTK